MSQQDNVPPSPEQDQVVGQADRFRELVSKLLADVRDDDLPLFDVLGGAGEVEGVDLTNLAMARVHFHTEVPTESENGTTTVEWVNDGSFDVSVLVDDTVESSVDETLLLSTRGDDGGRVLATSMILAGAALLKKMSRPTKG